MDTTYYNYSYLVYNAIFMLVIIVYIRRLFRKLNYFEDFVTVSRRDNYAFKPASFVEAKD